MRCIVIDPWTRSVREEDYNGHYTDIYRLLSNDEHKVGCFDVVRYMSEDSGIFVDDEGLYADVPAFKLRAHGQPLSGMGVVIGNDHLGESVALSDSYTVEGVTTWVEAWLDRNPTEPSFEIIPLGALPHLSG